jgi:hypothetical protein
MKPEHAEIWRLLCDLADRGLIICPVCQPNYLEMLKLEPDSRLVVARAMDKLSLGIAIQPPQVLTGLEISYWAWKNLFGEATLAPIDNFVFTPIAFVFEQFHLTDTPFRPAEELVLQKALLDVFAALTLEDISLMANDWPASGDDDTEFQKKQTIQAASHRSAFNTFEEAYAIELDGVADLHEEYLQGFGQLLWDRGKRSINDSPADSPKMLTRELTAILIAGLKMGRIKTEIPTLHIDTSIHATIRYTRQKFCKGDLWDFRHAVAALGYCDAFFTDHRLANLLKSKPPELAKQYSCTIISKDEQIIEFLQEIGTLKK